MAFTSSWCNLDVYQIVNSRTAIYDGVYILHMRYSLVLIRMLITGRRNFPYLRTISLVIPEEGYFGCVIRISALSKLLVLYLLLPISSFNLGQMIDPVSGVWFITKLLMSLGCHSFSHSSIPSFNHSFI